jgi:hypothetical protein
MLPLRLRGGSLLLDGSRSCGMAGAQKVSISVEANDLKWRRRAKRRGGNLSAVFAEAKRLLRQREARERLLERFGEDADVSSQEAAAIRAEWRA